MRQGHFTMIIPNMSRLQFLPLFALQQDGHTRASPSNWTTLETAGGLLQPVPPLSAVKVRSRVVANFGRSCRAFLATSFFTHRTRSRTRTMAVFTARIPSLDPLIKRKLVNEQIRTDREISQKNRICHRRRNTLRRVHQPQWHPVKLLHGIIKT